jgi:hypothetical protein
MADSHVQRNRQITTKQIHSIKAHIGMSDDNYRGMLQMRHGVASSTELDTVGLSKLLGYMKLLADQHAPAAPIAGMQTASRARRTRPPLTPKQKKLWALWCSAVAAKKFRLATWAALSAWCKRQTGGESGVSRVEWLNNKQIDLCIDTLQAIVMEAA